MGSCASPPLKGPALNSPPPPGCLSPLSTLPWPQWTDPKRKGGGNLHWPSATPCTPPPLEQPQARGAFSGADPSSLREVRQMGLGWPSRTGCVTSKGGWSWRPVTGATGVGQPAQPGQGLCCTPPSAQHIPDTGLTAAPPTRDSPGPQEKDLRHKARGLEARRPAPTGCSHTPVTPVHAHRPVARRGCLLGPPGLHPTLPWASAHWLSSPPSRAFRSPAKWACTQWVPVPEGEEAKELRKEP